jgi:feruloyl esterase
MISSLVLLAAIAQQPACEALKSVSLPNTKITTAELVAAGPQQGARGQTGAPLPAHCRVAATLTPSSDSHIEMELWMPAENWNGKFLAVGNGGFAGSIDRNDMAAGLRKGYASASNDTGHQGGGGAAFAVGHPEKVVDFGYRSMHEMAVQSKALIQAYYKRGPQLSYFQGCSTGGRQGMMEAQRYPEDFDAIIAGAPVYNMVHLSTSQMTLFVEMLKEPARILPPAKIKLFADAVLSACDAKDGVKDSIVSDPQMCKFDPATLLCKAGDAADCLTAAQVDNANRAAYGTVKTKTGALVYPGRSPGFESALRMPAPGAPINPLYSDMNRYIGRQNANWDFMTFDLDADLALAIKNGSVIEANDPDLAKFKARDGKLLLWHGWADPGPAPENTVSYHDAVVKKLGGARQDDWMRLFLMPGVAHCGGGVGPDQADFLGAMERWKESGVAPNEIVASRRAGQPEMTRPICPYPQVAKYSGTASTNDAKNFVCGVR